MSTVHAQEQTSDATQTLPESTTLGTAPESLSALCTDRPSKSNYACTVDAGHFQYESDLVNENYLREGARAATTWLIANPTFKYGVTGNLDLEANMAALESVHTRYASGGTDTTLAGISDLYLRAKFEFANWPNFVQAAIIPYVKVPTARVGIGDGVLEGGFLLPVNYEPNSVVTLTFMPEADIYKDSVGSGKHVNVSQVVTFAFNLPRNLTLYSELWDGWNFDRAGTVRQESVDFAVAYAASNYLQLDTGANVGLNRATPQVQVYVGLSQKF